MKKFCADFEKILRRFVLMVSRKT